MHAIFKRFSYNYHFFCTITYIEKRHLPLQFHVSSFKNALAKSVDLTSKFSITFQIYNEQI